MGYPSMLGCLGKIVAAAKHCDRTSSFSTVAYNAALCISFPSIVTTSPLYHSCCSSTCQYWQGSSCCCRLRAEGWLTLQTPDVARNELTAELPTFSGVCQLQCHNWCIIHAHSASVWHASPLCALHDHSWTLAWCGSNGRVGDPREH